MEGKLHEFLSRALDGKEWLCSRLHLLYCLGKTESTVCRGDDKSLAFPISYFPICSTTKIIFLGWVREVRTTKS
jgi:hypothetical protein